MRQQLFVALVDATPLAMTPDPELQAAIDRAYDVFAPHGRPGRLDASPARDGERILADLTFAPLRRLPVDRLGGYAGWAMTTVGDDKAYRHFLPRILELAALDGGGHMGTDPEILAGKILYGGFQGWPRDERAAVVGVFTAAARQAIGEALDQATPDPWLIGLEALGESVSPLLADWLAATSLDAGLQLVEAVRSDAFRGDDPARSPPRAPALRLWLRGPAVLKRLETLLLEAPEDETWRVEAALIERERAG